MASRNVSLRSGRRPDVSDADDDCRDREQPGNQRYQHQDPKRVAGESGRVALHGPDDRGRDQDAGKCAGRVHGAMESERHSPVLRVSGVGDQRVSRRGPDPLTEPIPDAADQDHGPCGRHQVEHLGRDRRPVADPDEQPPPTEPVRQRSADELEDRGRAFCDSLDQADRRDRGEQYVRQEERDNVDEHLARNVREQAHQPQRHHVARHAPRQRPPPARSGTRSFRSGRFGGGHGPKSRVPQV